MNKRITEEVNANTENIDEMNALEIATMMWKEDQSIYHGIDSCLSDIAKAIDMIVDRWQQGGRVFVVGAGTSGRIGVLDAAELGPTFSVKANRWMAFLAGGHEATWKPLEQHEDNSEDIVKSLKEHELKTVDAVIGMSASGSTPYSVAALTYGKEVGAATISISCNTGTVSGDISDVNIEAIVGPEVIRGSTRLKAGTAQKMILNTISTGVMIRLGKVYKNEMIEMQLMNHKLKHRAEATLMKLADVDEQQATYLMELTDHHLKKALFIALTNASLEESTFYLNKTNGHLKQAIQLFYEP
ncbi:N-acetylmuramic acid 6-phosphate etherase [Gracilibacillus sp. YIM 98692]|uniref:N-acetylmuramic acid 6-phosphate etherase n=1 Tax=Gracilibacillus sp. YIM 98692 TaxID=2663532 RepID=UPI0013D87E97|nr:N-acetylmuramic acid 6-phosphate etherase [Gracilibacillus sp. YIM 98692]